ncbi:unnamed protein product [Absidia cylindrospora]
MTSGPQQQSMCPASPVSFSFDKYKGTWSPVSFDSHDSFHSTPSLSSCSSTFSSPTTMYLPIASSYSQDAITPEFSKLGNTTPLTRCDSSLSSSSSISSPPPPQTRTPWTSSEDFLLQKGYSQGLSWAMISNTYLPHRSRGCCWGRFKTLQAKLSERREWSTTEDNLLLAAIKKQDRLFKQAWKAVAREMGDRSWRECDVRSSKLTRTIRKQQRKQPY